jgi:hypothetical protein
MIDRLSDFLLDAFIISAVLIIASIAGNLIADNLEGKIARRCAVSLSEITR